MKFSAKVDFYTLFQNIFYWSQNTKKTNNKKFTSLKNTFQLHGSDSQRSRDTEIIA